MSLISLILNILWIITGGIWMAAAWLLAAVIMAITIIGLPWARSAFNIASYTLAPFGRTAVSRDEWDGRTDFGTSPLGMVGNLIWFLLAGWWLALGHVMPSRPGEFHPEPLTEPDLSLSTYPARATP